MTESVIQLQRQLARANERGGRVERQRDELLAALRAMALADSCGEITPEIMIQASDAIANAEKTK